MGSKVRVEVCVTSVAEARAAEAAGADTVELCSELTVGGVTPGPGLIGHLLRSLHIPVRVLVRPRAGDFVYDEADGAVLRGDVQALRAFDPAPRIVTGALTPGRALDLPLMRAVRDLAPHAELTLHRAIDHATDPMALLEQALEAGMVRILTSGGASRAVDGANVIAALVERSNGTGLNVAAAGGIGPADVVRLVEHTGVREVHFAAQRTVPVTDAGRASLSSGHDTSISRTVPDREKITGVLEALDKAGLR